jgi:hypothetical protein
MSSQQDQPLDVRVKTKKELSRPCDAESSRRKSMIMGRKENTARDLRMMGGKAKPAGLQMNLPNQRAETAERVYN